MERLDLCLMSIAKMSDIKFEVQKDRNSISLLVPETEQEKFNKLSLGALFTGALMLADMIAVNYQHGALFDSFRVRLSLEPGFVYETSLRKGVEFAGSATQGMTQVLEWFDLIEEGTDEN